MQGGRTIVSLRRDAVPPVASSLINHQRSRVGMLAITRCERPAEVAQLLHDVTGPDSEACCRKIPPRPNAHPPQRRSAGDRRTDSTRVQGHELKTVQVLEAAVRLQANETQI